MARKPHGITVQLIVRTEGNADAIGNPTYTDTSVDVENVLVAPVSDQEILDSSNLYGKKAVYVLGIPKGDTHEWKDTFVSFFGRTFRTFGPVTEGIEDLIPLKWNKKVQVEEIGT